MNLFRFVKRSMLLFATVAVLSVGSPALAQEDRVPSPPPNPSAPAAPALPVPFDTETQIYESPGFFPGFFFGPFLPLLVFTVLPVVILLAFVIIVLLLLRRIARAVEAIGRDIRSLSVSAPVQPRPAADETVDNTRSPDAE
jgi:hypothetical protein